MNNKLPFEREDLELLRVPSIVLAACLATALVMYFGANFLNDAATLSVDDVRVQFEQANDSVQLIEDEEAAIIRYIDRYKEFAKNGYVSKEDRLGIIEDLSTIRKWHKLFPINIDIGEQGSHSLIYDPFDTNVGDPVNLLYSGVEVRFPLLHEEDFTRLINDLLDTGRLLLPKRCEMVHNNVNEIDFSTFTEQMQSSCIFFGYTFDLNPPEPVDEEF